MLLERPYAIYGLWVALMGKLHACSNCGASSKFLESLTVWLSCRIFCWHQRSPLLCRTAVAMKLCFFFEWTFCRHSTGAFDWPTGLLVWFLSLLAYF